MIVEMALPHMADTGPSLKGSKFPTLAMDLTGLTRPIILPLCSRIWRDADRRVNKPMKSFEIY